MKYLFAVPLLILIALTSSGQTLTYNSDNKKKLKFLDHIGFTIYGVEMTPIELEIGTMESRECEALIKRDTIALKNIWVRDFSLDAQMNGLVSGKNSLPYYTSLSRMVETFSAMDSVAFTSGHEMVQMLEPGGKLKDPVKQTFFHTWRRKFGVWKLTTKTK